MTLYRQLCLCNTHTHRLYSWKSELLFCPRKIMACFLICTRIYVTVAMYLFWPSTINFDISGFLTSLSWGRESEHVFCLVCLESHPVVYLSSESANGLCWEVDLWSVLRERESQPVFCLCPESQPMVCLSVQRVNQWSALRSKLWSWGKERERVSLCSVCLESQPVVLSVQRVNPWSFYLDGEPIIFDLSWGRESQPWLFTLRADLWSVCLESQPMVLESAYGLGLSRERDSQPMVLVCQESQPMVLVCQERESTYGLSRELTYGLGLSDSQPIVLVCQERESTYGLSRESTYGLSSQPMVCLESQPMVCLESQPMVCLVHLWSWSVKRVNLWSI